MYKKKIAAFLLLGTMLFTSCTVIDVEGEAETKEEDTIIEAVEERIELWIEIGSRAYAEKIAYDFDLAAYFRDQAPVNTVLALSDDMYYHNPDAFEAVAVSFYQYVRDTYGEDALTDYDSRIAYKDEWLKTVDPSLSYSMHPELEEALSRITASSSDDYHIIAELDGVSYSFTGYNDSVTPYLAHGFMYYADEGLALLREEIARIDPEGTVFNTSAELRFTMDFGSTTYMRPDGIYSIGRYEDILSAAVMMMAESDDPKAHWITEGLAEILGKARGYYFFAVYDRVFYLHPSTEETLRAYADAGEAIGLFHTDIMDRYYAHGGTIGEGAPAEFSHIADYRYSIDGELYTHAAALASMKYGYLPRLDTLYIVRSDGGELSRMEAGSFVLWLMQNYKTGDILTVCRDYGKLEEVFGKDYDTLKAEWTAWLEAEFE